MEIWKSVKGYEGLYEVSSFGRVKTMSRSYVAGHGAVIHIKERVMIGGGKKCKGVRYDYHSVVLSKNGKPKTFETHKLVAIAFLNHTPCGYAVVVDHIDGNSINNNIDNLRLITNRENTSRGMSNLTGYRGVSRCHKTGTYGARALIKGKRKFSGSFETAKEAHNWYLKMTTIKTK